MIYNFLSVYGIYYPSGTIETRAKWRILIQIFLHDFVPTFLQFMAPSLTPHRHANFVPKNSSDGPFIYSALSARKKKQEEIPWVLGDPADIAMTIHNPLPFELRVQKMVCTSLIPSLQYVPVSFPVYSMYQSHSQSAVCTSLIPSLQYVPVSFPVCISYPVCSMYQSHSQSAVFHSKFAVCTNLIPIQTLATCMYM